MKLSADKRSRVEEYVRPLYQGLDGVETFGRVASVQRRLADLGKQSGADEELLELMVLFHGVVGRLGSLAPGSRWQLFVSGLGLPPERVAILRRALQRFEDRPATTEERLLHDAVLLERCGIGAALENLLVAGRKRLAVDRALAQLDAGPEPARFCSPRGRKIAARRHAATARWLAELRSLVAAEELREEPGPS